MSGRSAGGMARVDRPGARSAPASSCTPAPRRGRRARNRPERAGRSAPPPRGRGRSRRRACRRGRVRDHVHAVVERRVAGGERPGGPVQLAPGRAGSRPRARARRGGRASGSEIPARAGDGEDRLARRRSATARPSIVARPSRRGLGGGDPVAEELEQPAHRPGDALAERAEARLRHDLEEPLELRSGASEPRPAASSSARREPEPARRAACPHDSAAMNPSQPRRSAGRSASSGRATSPPCPSDEAARGHRRRSRPARPTRSGGSTLPIGPPSENGREGRRSRAAAALVLDHARAATCPNSTSTSPGRAKPWFRQSAFVPGVAAVPRARVGVGAVLHDPDRVDQRLDVVHDRRASVEAGRRAGRAGAGAPRRGAPPGPSAGRSPRRRRSCRAPETTRTSNGGPDPESAPPRIPAARASSTARSSAARARGVLGAHERDALAGAHRQGADRHALEHPCGSSSISRRSTNEPGSPSSPLADHISRLGRRRRGEAPLAARSGSPRRLGRVARALHGRQHRLGPVAERPLERRVRAVPPRAGQVREAAAPEAAGDDRLAPGAHARRRRGRHRRGERAVGVGAGAGSMTRPSRLRRAGERSQCPRQRATRTCARPARASASVSPPASAQEVPTQTRTSAGPSARSA